MYKKPLSVILVGLLSLQSLTPVSYLSIPQAHAISGKVRCITTGYYSPIAGQSYYVRGSLEADKKLNGNGTNGADGTPVFQGMIAAPKSIAFGTKISIPGVGVGIVHDRGGAIKELSDGSDVVYRFDIWFGAGDEGLKRALAWGMREDVCEIFEAENALDSTLSFENIPSIQLPKPSSPHISSGISRSLELGSSGDEVSLLQKQLKAAGFYPHDITGNFGDLTLEALIDFQLSRGIISSREGWGAGVVGPKTRSALAGNYKAPAVSTPAETNNSSEDDILVQTQFILAAGMGKEATGSEVKKLQYLLSSLGHYPGEISGEYDYQTIQAVLSFQKARSIIKTEGDYGAGYFGPKTQEALMQEVTSIVNNMKKYPSESSEEFGTITTPDLTASINQKSRGASLVLPAPVVNEMIFDSFNTASEIMKEDAQYSANQSNSAVFVADPFFFTPVSFDETSSEVQKIQLFLQKHSYFPQATPASGYFGNVTKKAIQAFQTANGLEASGDANTETLNKMNEVLMGWEGEGEV